MFNGNDGWMDGWMGFTHSPMHAIESDQQGVRVDREVLHILQHDTPEQHALLLGLGLDHVLAVVRIEEELTRLRVRQELDVIEVP